MSNQAKESKFAFGCSICGLKIVESGESEGHVLRRVFRVMDWGFTPPNKNDECAILCPDCKDRLYGGTKKNTLSLKLIPKDDHK
jgi:hypothetical protein